MAEYPSGAIAMKKPEHDRREWASAPSQAASSVHPGKGKLCLECGRVVSQSFAVCPQCGTPVSIYRHLDVRKEGDVIIVQIGKPLIVDEQIVKEVGEELCSAVDHAEHHNLVLNLSKVVALSGSMLSKLIMLEKRMEQHQRQLKLCNVTPEVREVLAATKLHRILQMSVSEAEAIKEFAFAATNGPPGVGESG
jgi:anti-anti-sigma factor